MRHHHSLHVLKNTFFLTLDFDECQSNQTNSCSQLCINAPGSFSCECQNGYSLNDDKESCDGTYDNTHHHDHRPLVIVDNSLVVNYHSVLSQEPITRSLHLPYKPSESTLSDEKIFIETLFGQNLSRTNA